MRSEDTFEGYFQEVWKRNATEISRSFGKEDVDGNCWDESGGYDCDGFNSGGKDNCCDNSGGYRNCCDDGGGYDCCFGRV